MIEFDTHDVLCLVSSIVCTQYALCLSLILMMFYLWFRVSFDTQYVLVIVSKYRLILGMFYVTFQGYPLGSLYSYC